MQENQVVELRVQVSIFD